MFQRHKANNHKFTSQRSVVSIRVSKTAKQHDCLNVWNRIKTKRWNNGRWNVYPANAKSRLWTLFK